MLFHNSETLLIYAILAYKIITETGNARQSLAYSLLGVVVLPLSEHI